MFSTLLTNHKTKGATARVLLCIGLLLSGNKLAVAQEEQPKDMTSTQNSEVSQKFDLNASFTDGLQLSRQGVNGKPSKPDASAEQALPDPTPTAVAAAMPPVPQAFETGAFSAGTTRETQTPQYGTEQPGNSSLKSGASLSEYGVDWSTWMSQVADRWYFQLTKLEAQSPYDFYTDGPAQIEFTCYPNGQVSNIVLRRSCGVPMYDRMQIIALLSSAPMPPFPRGTQRTSYTLCQGWEAHARRPGEADYQPGTFGKDTPVERVERWD